MKKLVIQIFVMFCCFVGYGQEIDFGLFTGTSKPSDWVVKPMVSKVKINLPLKWITKTNTF